MIRKKVLAIPLVAASETGVAQTNRIYMIGVVGQDQHLVARSYKIYVYKNELGSSTPEGNSPVLKMHMSSLILFLSSSRHEWLE